MVSYARFFVLTFARDRIPSERAREQFSTLARFARSSAPASASWTPSATIRTERFPLRALFVSFFFTDFPHRRAWCWSGKGKSEDERAAGAAGENPGTTRGRWATRNATMAMKIEIKVGKGTGGELNPSCVAMAMGRTNKAWVKLQKIARENVLLGDAAAFKEMQKFRGDFTLASSEEHGARLGIWT